MNLNSKLSRNRKRDSQVKDDISQVLNKNKEFLKKIDLTLQECIKKSSETINLETANCNSRISEINKKHKNFSLKINFHRK